MSDEPDVRLEGVPLETLHQWADTGNADKTTSEMTHRLNSLAAALAEHADIINAAVQKAGGQWEGSTAQAATTSMTALRDYADAVQRHSADSDMTANGQSGMAWVTRKNMPPKINYDPRSDDTVTGHTGDPQLHAAARTRAEDQARQVMGEYHTQTAHYVSSLPVIPAVPKVVVDTGGDAPPTGGGGSTVDTHPRHQVVDPGSGHVSPNGSVPVASHHGTDVGVPAGPHGGSTPVSAGTSASSAPAGSAPVVPGAGSAVPGGAVPGGAVSGGVGPGGGGSADSVAGPGSRWGTSGTLDLGPSPVGAGAGGASGGGYRGGDGQSPGGASRGTAGPGPGGGARSGAGTPGPGGAALAEDEALGRRAGAVRGGGAGGVGGMMGGAPGANGEDDDEHSNRYGVPSDEHFEGDDEFLRDPRDQRFYVAPDVIE